MNSFSANLSNDYFTNRQDRYFVIEDCKQLCDFYDELVENVGEFSFLLQPDGTTRLNSDTDIHPLKGSTKKFIEKAASGVKTLFQMELGECSKVGKTGVYIFTLDASFWSGWVSRSVEIQESFEFRNSEEV